MPEGASSGLTEDNQYTVHVSNIKGGGMTYTSSHTRACPWCWGHSFPVSQLDAHLIHILQINKNESTTYQHLLILANPYALALDDLQVLETAQNIVLDLEDNLDPERRAFFDSEGLVFQRLKRTRGREIDHHILTSFHLES